ncbi:uncharacterized protein si:dkey-225f5.4 isoform X2 [Scyliorhinus canicula]|uniref:uncharacterized protein si:dkey-225f5.4 isoform X2 n=1 Tax=Scyliorhinus canicula TaxID=7830 RepID=UPI0018F3F62F|nr:uncharacterized protein si:dkey-225f5.4 isoform X2 [Scyliorhinus canicula]
MAAEAQRLLKEAEAAKRIHEEDENILEEGPAVVQHAIGFRRNQKMMFRQLKTCALFLDTVINSDVREIKEHLQQQDIQKKLNETRQKWKSLKAECRLQDEELQNVSAILLKFQALETKQQTLRDAIKLHEAKKLQLEVALQQKSQFKESNCSFLDLSEMESVDLPNMTAEIWKRYLSQAELWGEIQHLQNRYAIDWLEEERQLKFLQLIAGSSSNVVCTLYVEPGYPGNGEVKFSSIQENNKLTDTVIKPPQAKPSLSDWLEYLNMLECWKA